MKVSEALATRKSVRRFTERQVAAALVRELLEVASRAPSGGNTQPWHVYVLTGEARQGLTDAVMAEAMAGNMRGFSPCEERSGGREVVERVIERLRA